MAGNNAGSRACVARVAERQGFEPWVPARTHLISSQAHSAALAPLRWRLSLKAAVAGNRQRDGGDAGVSAVATDLL